MKKVLKRGVVLTALILLLSGFTSRNIVNAETKDVPHIEFKGYDHDFGDVLQDTKPKHTFTFKNTGNRKLIIEKIKAG